MANEEVLGPRKTMFILVIVVGCFAVLWPRILSPLILGPSREQLKPNQFDRDAGCCEVLFETDMVVLELINEVCSSAVQADGKLNPYAAAQCRKAVNETCGVDLAAFLKRNENVGKTSKMLVETMKNSNSSCLREHFGVPVWSLGVHSAQNSWTQQDTIKQERPLIRGAGPHPALRERGRAIPAGAPAPAVRNTVTMPPHARVRSSPLSGYFELDIKPPPIPGMRPPLGSPGGPVPAPKSSMGFVMPIYTICIIVFFVYTLSKILFKRTGLTPYEPLTPDPQFRRRVFRDDSRSSPDKLVVTAISGLVDEVRQQMEASYAQNQQRQDVQQDNDTRPYTNGSILHNSGPVRIVASEYREKSPEVQKEPPSPVAEESTPETDQSPEVIESTPETEESPEVKESTPEPQSPADTVESVETEIKQKESTPELETPEPQSVEKPKDSTESIEPVEKLTEVEETTTELKEPDIKESTPEKDIQIKEAILEPKESTPEKVTTKSDDTREEEEEVEEEEVEIEIVSEESPEREISEEPQLETNLADELIQLADDIKVQKNGDLRHTEEFLKEETKSSTEQREDKQSTPELLEDAIKDEDEHENASVKVVGMEVTAHAADGGAWRPPPPAAAHPATPAAPALGAPQRAHEAEQVQSIFLETEIPQQSRVLVTDFAENRTDKPAPSKHSPMVVSGKMTLSLIQDAPRETPERDPESTVDDFTTASAVTQNAEKDDESDEEIDEEIEIEEIEEEVEEEEEDEDVAQKDQKGKKTE